MDKLDLSLPVTELEDGKSVSLWIPVVEGDREGEKVFTLGMAANGAALYLFRPGERTQIVRTTDLAAAWMEKLGVAL